MWIYMCICLICSGTHRGEEWETLLELKIQAAESHPVKVVGLNSGSLQEQQMFLTIEQSF